MISKEMIIPRLVRKNAADNLNKFTSAGFEWQLSVSQFAPGNSDKIRLTGDVIEIEIDNLPAFLA